MTVVGHSIRDFTVHTASGPVAWSRLRGRKNLVLVLLAGEGQGSARRLIGELADRYDEIKEQTSEVVVVFPSEEEAREVNLPFPAAWDPEGILAREYAHGEQGEVSALLVTDRFGEVFLHQWLAPPAGAMDADSVLGMLEFIEKQCPECGAPVWGG